MNLSVQERVIILSILPKEGSYATLKILEELRMNLSFNEKEYKQYGITEKPVGDGRVMTDWKKDEEVEITIGEKANDIIVDAFKRLDKENKIPVQAKSAYEKFIPDN